MGLYFRVTKQTLFDEKKFFIEDFPLLNADEVGES